MNITRLGSSRSHRAPRIRPCDTLMLPQSDTSFQPNLLIRPIVLKHQATSHLPAWLFQRVISPRPSYLTLLNHHSLPQCPPNPPKQPAIFMQSVHATKVLH